MDGSDRQIMVDVDIGDPNSLAIDFNSYEVCWADAGSQNLGVRPKIGQLCIAMCHVTRVRFYIEHVSCAEAIAATF